MSLQQLDVAVDPWHHDQNPAKIPSESILRWARFPQLRVLDIYAPLAKLQHLPLDGSPIYNLLTLSIRYSQPLPYSTLKWLNQRLPHLRTLCLCVFGAGQETRLTSGLNGWRLMQPFSPATYPQLLREVSNSLEHLTLIADSIEYSSHDGTVADLSEWSELRSLRIGSDMLFGSGPTSTADASDRPELWTLLPPNLETLDIDFNKNQGLYWPFAEMRRQGWLCEFKKNLWERRHDDSHISWIFQLLERRARRENMLKWICVNEEVSHDGVADWKIIWWRGTPQLRDFAVSVDVNTCLRLRVPYNIHGTDVVVVDQPVDPDMRWDWGASGLSGSGEENDESDSGEEIDDSMDDEDLES